MSSRHVALSPCFPTTLPGKECPPLPDQESSLLHISVVHTCVCVCARVFVYVCKCVCQSEDMIGEKVLSIKFLLAYVFSRKSPIPLMGELVRRHCQPHPTPFVIDSSRILLVSHLPQVPQELPRDSPWRLTLWALCPDGEVGAFQVLGVLANNNVSGIGRPCEVCVLVRWRPKFFWTLSWSSPFLNCESSFCGIFCTSSERTFFSGNVFRAPVTVALLGFQRVKGSSPEVENLALKLFSLFQRLVLPHRGCPVGFSFHCL